jgi:hypothetical protein
MSGRPRRHEAIEKMRPLPLNHRRAAFARAIAEGCSNAEAQMRAGYRVNRKNGNLLLRNPRVMAEIISNPNRDRTLSTIRREDGSGADQMNPTNTFRNQTESRNAEMAAQIRSMLADCDQAGRRRGLVPIIEELTQMDKRLLTHGWKLAPPALPKADQHHEP